LNGCESATGAFNSTDGRLSPGLFFTLAGAQGVVEHLWKASDKSSTQIAEVFYKNYQNQKPSTALFQAKIKYLENCPSGLDHPHYWAGIVYTSLLLPENSPAWLPPGFLIILFLFIIVYVFWKKGRSRKN